MIVFLASTAGGPASDADVQALRREVEELRSEVGSLRFAIAEVARLNQRQADTLRRALGDQRSETTKPPTKQQPRVETKTRAKQKRPPPPPPAPRLARVAKAKSRGGTVVGRVKVPKGEPVAYVYVENVRGRLVSGQAVTIEQSGKKFVPSWAVVEKGTSIAFPNRDPIYHNVFSRSKGNNFDLGLYRRGDASKKHRFIKAGPVDVFCNIHPRMFASVLVVPNRLFAKVKPDGTFRIDGVPQGRRKVVAWSPRSSASSQWVELPDGGQASVELALERKSSAHKNKLGRPYGSYP